MGNPDEAQPFQEKDPKWVHLEIRWRGQGGIEDPERLRGLAIGAFYSCGVGVYCDGLAMEPEEKRAKVSMRETLTDSLAQWWGITSEQEALAVIEPLVTAQFQTPSYAAVHPLVMSVRDAYHEDPRQPAVAQHREFLQTLAGFRDHDPAYYLTDYDTWLQAVRLGVLDRLPLPPPDSIAGWDLCRGVNLVRQTFTLNYLGEDMAWHLIDVALGEVRERFGSWRQLGNSFLTGATYWQATQDMASMVEIAGERWGILAQLHNRPDSPWRRLTLFP